MLTIDNSQSIQIRLFQTADEIVRLVAPDLSGFERFDRRLDVFLFLMRDPDASMSASVSDNATEYLSFYNDQFGA